MPYIGNTPAEKYAAFDVQYFTTSATTSYTLDHAVANELDIRLVINNVIQEPGSGKAYTAAGTTLTLSAATAGTDTMYCVYTAKASQTVNPPAGSVGINQLSASGTKDATTFLAGDNSFKTVSGTTINNNADNRVITGSGTANTLEGEANLRFDGSTVRVGSGTTSAQANGDDVVIEGSANTGLTILSGNDDLAAVYLGQNGANNDCKFEYDNDTNALVVHTNATEAMKIDGAGIVTKPLQPTFMTNQTGALTVANGHTLFSTNTTERWDIGSNLSGPTFTAPVTGKYFLNFDVLWEGNTSDSSFEARITTSNRNYSFNRNSRQYANNSTYIANSGSAIADMDAGDTAIVVHVGPTTAVHADNNWTWFQGYLLG